MKTEINGEEWSRQQGFYKDCKIKKINKHKWYKCYFIVQRCTYIKYINFTFSTYNLNLLVKAINHKIIEYNNAQYVWIDYDVMDM